MGTKSHSLQSPAASCRASRGCQACMDGSGLQKKTLCWVVFFGCCFCLHPRTEPRPRRCLGSGTKTSLSSSEILPAHILGSRLCFSQPHSHPAMSRCEASQPTTDVLDFCLHIHRLHFVVLKNCSCMSLGLLLHSLRSSWGLPAFPLRSPAASTHF